jgi:hypothetical protein
LAPAKRRRLAERAEDLGKAAEQIEPDMNAEERRVQLAALLSEDDDDELHRTLKEAKGCIRDFDIESEQIAKQRAAARQHLERGSGSIGLQINARAEARRELADLARKFPEMFII